jgi:drug/metabolite transporter (DMT)-like permease
MTAFLFAVIVIAWGFTWYAIRVQVGMIAPELSLFWRFAAAALVMWLILAATRRLEAVPLRRHRWFAIMGASLFGLNFVLIYTASQHIASGIVSVVFTMATVFNAFNQWAFFGKRPTARALAGAVLGIGGIALLFGETFTHLDASGETVLGVGLALAGTYVFSLGNLVSVRATATGTGLPNAVARGMTWGTFFMAVYLLATGHSFATPMTPAFFWSLAYLAIPGSVIGFMAYLSLVKRVGPERAAYATVLFPLVALAVSTVLEGYHWTPGAIAGLPLILLGNVVIFARLPLRFSPQAAPVKAP